MKSRKHFKYIFIANCKEKIVVFFTPPNPKKPPPPPISHTAANLQMSTVKSTVVMFCCAISTLLFSLLLWISIVYAACCRNTFSVPHSVCKDWISFVSQMVDISPTKIDSDAGGRAAEFYLKLWELVSESIRNNLIHIGYDKISSFTYEAKVPSVSTHTYTHTHIHNAMKGFGSMRKTLTIIC